MNRSASRREFLKMATMGTAAAVLAACQPKAPGKVAEPTVEATAAPAATEQPTAAPAPTEQPTVAPAVTKELTFTVAWGGAYAEMNTAIANRYTELHPNVKVETLPITGPDKIITMIAGGAPPDVFHQYYTTLAQLAYQEQMLTLDPYMEKSEAAKASNFEAYDLAMVTKDGEIYGLPYLDSGVIVGQAYNGRLFERAGLDPEKPPKTMAEFWDVCRKTSTRDDAGNIDILAAWPGSINALGMWAPPMGVTYYDPAERKFHINQEAFVKVWKDLKAYVDDVGGYERILAYGKVNEGWLVSLYNDKQVFYIAAGSWLVGDVKQNDPDLYEVFHHYWLPSDKGIKVTTPYVHTAGIAKQVKDREASWELLEFLCASDEVGDMGWDMRGVYYPWKPWHDSLDLSDMPQYKWYFDTLKPGVADVIITPNLELNVYAGTSWQLESSTFEAVMLNQMSVEEGLERLQKETQDLLDQALAAVQ